MAVSQGLGYASKEGKASSGNIGLKIDDELSFDKLKGC